MKNEQSKKHTTRIKKGANGHNSTLDMMTVAEKEALFKKIAKLRITEGLSVSDACLKENNGIVDINRTTYYDNINRFDLKDYEKSLLGDKIQEVFTNNITIGKVRTRTLTRKNADGEVIETVEEVKNEGIDPKILQLALIKHAPELYKTNFTIDNNNVQVGTGSFTPEDTELLKKINKSQQEQNELLRAKNSENK